MLLRESSSINSKKYMSSQVTISEIMKAPKDGDLVVLNGWINNIRFSGKIAFIELRDGTGYIQCVADFGELSEECVNLIKTTPRESSVQISGKLNEHPRKKGQFELKLETFDVFNVSEEFPIGKKSHGPDFLLENRHLWLRSKKQWAIQRIRNTVINSTYEFFNKENFIKIDSPILTPNACEGTTTLFSIDYFDQGKAYLSQSGQLYLEACIFAHNKVFDFGPVFRAEKSKTKKHLIEFWMMDAEMAFYDHVANMDLQERLIKHIVYNTLNNNSEELAILERDLSRLEKVNKPFPRVTHTEIVEQLRKKGSSITHDMDLGAADEKLLAEIYDVPVFIEKWPKQIKAFYMKPDPQNPDVVLAADLMAPEGFGELIGGSQREDDYAKLLQRINEENLSEENFSWYLDLRRYGSVPHSGFGFGLERLVTWISGAEHIRETIPFPRLLNRVWP